MGEKPFDFQKRLLEIHKPQRRLSWDMQKGEIEITKEWQIVCPENPLLRRVAEDLRNYFCVSMGISLTLSNTPAPQYGIAYVIDPTLPHDGEYRVEVTGNEVYLVGKTARDAAQASYLLEDLMNLREAPYLPVGTQNRVPKYRTRMVHSGYSLDVFPDEYLASIAHQGINTILLFVRGVDETSRGHTDFNDMISRAAAWGIDTYAYSYMKSRKHPDDADAEAFYDGLYGDLFRRCPGFKGIIFVGESVEFPSHDERTTMRLREDNFDKDGRRIITDRPNPGWFPCRDYPDWLELVKRTIRRERPDADIVFWTYNWGYQSEHLRLELIERLPTDISLQATFEMFEDAPRDGVPGRSTDYTLYTPIAGKYFLSEAKAAKARGIPLYSMTNTGGLTWDVGTVPFEPAPYQWLMRFDAVNQAHKAFGLVGLMESHHYGFFPSFISELAKYCFTAEEPDGEKMLRQLLIRDWGEMHIDTVQNAFRAFSDAVNQLITTNEDQYGPMRIGPSYPLVLYNDIDLIIPFGLEAMHGSNKICFPNYTYPFHCPGMKEKCFGEMRLYKRAAEMLIKGADALFALIPMLPERKREDAKRTAGIAAFMGRTALTTYHTKEWYLRKNALLEDPKVDFEATLCELEEIGKREIENAKATLPLVDFDSRLGFEPSMSYMCHREALEWKIALQERILHEDIAQLRHDGCVKDRNPRHFPRGIWE